MHHPSNPGSTHSLRNRLGRFLWSAVWLILIFPSPRIAHGWRRAILRLFGARIGPDTRIYPTARIWAPWQLAMEEGSCLGPHVICYNVAPITLGAHATISQYSHLCAASHDYRLPAMPVVRHPIHIEQYAWVASDAFVGPGVHIHEGAVVGARSVVMRDVAAWTVVAGNPASVINTRNKQSYCAP